MKAVRVIACSAVLALCIYYVRSKIKKNTTTQSISYEFDTNLSQQAKQSFTALCEASHIHDQQKLFEITKTIPYIKNITITCNNNRYSILVHAKTPMIRLHNNTVLYADGTTCQEDYYKKSMLSSLPIITIENMTPSNLGLCAMWITHQDPTLFDEYTITWISGQAIRYDCKRDETLRYLGCTNVALPDTALELTKNRINIIAQKKLLFDIRFKNQIIMRTIHDAIKKKRQKRGNGYEKNM